MLLRRSRDYQQFHFNELRPGITDLIRKAIKGEYSYENFKPAWIPREQSYARTAEYDDAFDTESFLDWAHCQKSPVFISEYEIKDPRFTLVKKMEKRSLLSSHSRELKFEKVYANRAAVKALRAVKPDQ